MFKLSVENKYGEVLELSQNPNYTIKLIDGIDPPDAVINTARNANADGSVFNSAYIDNRTITITLAINQPTETNRIALYKYFKSKYPVTLYYENDTRNVLIHGYCQSIPIGYFEKKELFQVTILCTDPYFEGVEQETAIFESAEALFEFPFEIETPIPFSNQTGTHEEVVFNGGDVETGALFVLHAKGIVVNPAIVNMDTNETFAFNVTLSAGDEIRLNTVVKQKSVLLYKANGTIQNLIGQTYAGASWFQLRPQENIFSVTAQGGTIVNLDMFIYLRDKFQGV
jgi:hypothetical protein